MFSEKQITATLSFSIILLLFFTSANAQMRKLHLDSLGNDISKMSFYTPSEGYVAFRDWIGYTNDSGKTFQKKYITLSNVDYNGYSVNLTFGFNIGGVKAFNQNTLIAYGDYGLVPAILYSSNGGLNYKLIFLSQYNTAQFKTGITDMAFLQNSSIGFAIDADRVLKTSNQGQSWTPVDVEPDSYFDHIEAIDDNTLFVFSTATNKLIKTVNAGSSWQAISLPNIENRRLNYVHFLTALTGWLNMDNQNGKGYLYQTVDGGVTWTLLNNTDAVNLFFTKIKFVSTTVGFATRLGNYEIYKTLNGGINWEPLARDNNYSYAFYDFNDLQSISANQIWAAGKNGFIEMSVNGGGAPLPKAYFNIDTIGLYNTNQVNLVNFSRSGYQYKWYVNNSLVSTNYNASYTHSLSSGADSVQLIVISGAQTDTLLKYQYFKVPNRPQITSFSPVTGSTGTFITIYGTGFTNINAVKIGGTDAASFTVVSANVITATVADGASGPVSVVDIYGAVSLPGFTYFAPSSSPAPIVTSISPGAGPIGTTVTITGSNFNNSPANNTVLFGSVKAQVLSATANTVICKVPAGISYEPVTVLDKVTGLIGQSPNPFNVTFPDSSNFTTNSFKPVFKSGYNKTSNVEYCAKGVDADGDGKPDILSSFSFRAESFGVYRNIADSNKFLFESRVNIPLTSNTVMLQFCAGDLDGDGKPDIAGTDNSSQIIVLKNSSTPGAISFNKQISLPVGGASTTVVITDLDNDGRNDLAVAAWNNIDVIRNTSSAGFLSFGETKHLTAPTIAGYTNVIAGDLDGDGKKDLVTYSTYSGASPKISLFLNSSIPGNISFSQVSNVFPSYQSSRLSSIQLLDCNNDNKLDIIILFDSTIQAFKNTSATSAISFASPVSYKADVFDNDLMIENFSGDSKPDMLSFSPYNTSTFSFHQNKSVNSNISFGNRIVNNLNISKRNGTADFNLDGKVDLVCSNTANSYGVADIILYSNNVGSIAKQSLCTGSTFYGMGDITGSSYQWQQDKGNGFTNLTDDNNISGAKTQNLVIAKIPFEWNGYKYRCVADSQFSTTTQVFVKPPILKGTINISSQDTSICYSVTAKFKATLNLGNSRLIQRYWLVNRVNAFSYDSTFATSSLRNGDTISCILITSDSCGNTYRDTSNNIVVSVYGYPGSLTVNTPNTSFCIGSKVTFDAVSVYQSEPYQWFVNGVLQAGETNSKFSTLNLKGTNTIYCTQSAGGCTVWSNTIQMNETTICPCIENQWLGSISNTWEDPANWSCGTVPTASSKVTISSGTVVINSNTTVYSLTAGPGVNLLVNAGFNLTVLH